MPAVCGENVQVIYYSARQDVRRIKNVARNAAPAGHYDPGSWVSVGQHSVDPRLAVGWFVDSQSARSARREMDCPLRTVFSTSPTLRTEILTSGPLLFHPFLPTAPQHNGTSICRNLYDTRCSREYWSSPRRRHPITGAISRQSERKPHR